MELCARRCCNNDLRSQGQNYQVHKGEYWQGIWTGLWTSFRGVDVFLLYPQYSWWVRVHCSVNDFTLLCIYYACLVDLFHLIGIEELLGEFIYGWLLYGKNYIASTEGCFSEQWLEIQAFLSMINSPFLWVLHFCRKANVRFHDSFHQHYVIHPLSKLLKSAKEKV